MQCTEALAVTQRLRTIVRTEAVDLAACAVERHARASHDAGRRVQPARLVPHTLVLR